MPPELVWTEERASLVVTDVWASAPDDVYATLSNGVIMHSTGDGTWQSQDTGTASRLTGIWGSGPNDIYVSVYANVILHSTGDGVWEHEVQKSGLTFDGVWGSGPNDVYALSGGVYHRTDSSIWDGPQTVTGGTPLAAVWGSGANDIYIAAAGPTGTSIIYHSTGDGSWHAQSAPYVTGAYEVWGVGPQQIYVGAAENILFSSGDGNWEAQFTVPDVGFRGIWAADAEHVYACGSDGLFYRSNGAGQWSEGQRFHDPALVISCNAMWGTGPDNIYLGTGGGIFRGTASP